MSNYFMGLDGFVWFTGVVEDRDDPSKLGRVKVRCLGFHTEDKNKIPTADLPWAHVMHSVTDPCMQGMGNSPTFLVEGSWVVGFFRDANEKQQPIVIGSLPGVPSSTVDETKGVPLGITIKIWIVPAAGNLGFRMPPRLTVSGRAGEPVRGKVISRWFDWFASPLLTSLFLALLFP